MSDDISGEEVKAILSKTATSRESQVNAAMLLGQLIKTPNLVMAQNHTADAQPTVANQPPNAAGAVDPLAR